MKNKAEIKTVFALMAAIMASGTNAPVLAKESDSGDICAQPSAHDELKEFTGDPRKADAYYDRLESQRRACTAQRLEALVSAVINNEQIVSAAARAIESIMMHETDNYILSESIERMKELGLTHSSIARDAMSTIASRLKPLTPARIDDASVRGNAIRAIGALGLKYRSLRDDSFDHIDSMLGDKSPQVRWEAARQLRYLAATDRQDGPYRRAAIRSLSVLDRDAEDPDVRREAKVGILFLESFTRLYDPNAPQQP